MAVQDPYDHQGVVRQRVGVRTVLKASTAAEIRGARSLKMDLIIAGTSNNTGEGNIVR